MSNLNWATAPIDATHGGNSPYERGVVTWFKDVGHGNHSFLNDGSMQSWHKGSSNLREWSLVERPKQWSGPEDGLPPAGTVCEHKRVHEWQQVEVFAVKPNYNGSNTALFTYGNGCWGGCAEPSFFRAILTPAQLRESAIRELMDIAQVDCRVTAARLVDAGFKREVV